MAYSKSGGWRVYSKGKYSRAKTRSNSKNKKMGKMFRTKAGRIGCYVYINGKRSHFEEATGSQAKAWYRANTYRKV